MALGITPGEIVLKTAVPIWEPLFFSVAPGARHPPDRPHHHPADFKYSHWLRMTTPEEPDEGCPYYYHQAATHYTPEQTCRPLGGSGVPYWPSENDGVIDGKLGLY